MKDEIVFVGAISQLGQDEWNRLLGPNSPGILRWEYLALLEASGSICADTGWQPAHFSLRRDGELLAAAPLYIKTHSWGEYVYDFQWADVANRLGLDYYPKLVGCIPATPAEAWQLLMAPALVESATWGLFLAAIEEFCRAESIHSQHFLFVDSCQSADLAKAGYQEWQHQNFRWANTGYRDFAAFSDRIGKNMRRNIRRERQSVRDQGFGLQVIPGNQANDRTRELMAEYYIKTNDRFGPWAARFLTPDFFHRLPEFIPHGHSFSAAFLPAGAIHPYGLGPGEPFALSFLLHDQSRMLGRFWGAAGDRRELHFEVCYYQPIEWAIGQGILSYDPGPGSEHKVRRGFAAVATSSWHRFNHRPMTSLFKQYIPQFNAQNASLISSLNQELPYKKGDQNDE